MNGASVPKIKIDSDWLNFLGRNNNNAGLKKVAKNGENSPAPKSSENTNTPKVYHKRPEGYATTPQLTMPGEPLKIGSQVAQVTPVNQIYLQAGRNTNPFAINSYNVECPNHSGAASYLANRLDLLG